MEAIIWRPGGRTEEVPEAAGAAVPLAELTPGDDAVILEPHELVEAIEPALGRLTRVELRFGAFSDGRAFSQAALLRSRFGFTGDIRAVGEVLYDQVPFMLRAGFSSLLVSDAATRARLAEGAGGVSRYYQTAPGDRDLEDRGRGRYSVDRAEGIRA